MKYRKSQISLYIIIGMVILLYFYLNWTMDTTIIKPDSEEFIRKQLSEEGQVQAVNNYVRSCLRSSAMGPINEISLMGGSLMDSGSRWYDNVQYFYRCSENGKGCINKLPSKISVQQELKSLVLANMRECVDIKLLSSLGPSSFGDMDLELTIGDASITMSLNFPFWIETNQSRLFFDNFEDQVFVPLGFALDIGHDILNQYNTEGYIDSSEYLFNARELSVVMHKPHPDTVISLTNENFTFDFGIKGGHSSANHTGSCVYGSVSALNVEAVDCISNKGKFHEGDYNKLNINKLGCCLSNGQCSITDNNSCKGLFDEDYFCSGLACSNMDCVVGNTTWKHGESWCEYEGISGKGSDLIGSRHFVNRCIEGKVVIEECKDYREEICSQNYINYGDEIFSQAICRPNRWQDCQKCESQTCCEDRSTRDCYWIPDRCVPYVPPGFKTWDYSGTAQCALNNEIIECEDFECLENWMNLSYRGCYMGGDCGNYLNTEYALTRSGYYVIGHEVSSKYLDPIEGQNTVNWSYLKSERGILSDTRSRGITPGFITLISNGIHMLDLLSNYNLSDYVDLNSSINTSVIGVSMCLPSQAPEDNYNCFDCYDSDYPCTEYKCRSLGSHCEYRDIKGIGQCYHYVPDDNDIPKIDITNITIKVKLDEERDIALDFDNTSLLNITGARLIRSFEPGDRLFLNVDTVEDTICRASFLPGSAFHSLSPASFSADEFSNTHELEVYLSDYYDLFSRFSGMFGVSSISELMSTLVEFKSKLEYLQITYPQVARFSQGYYPIIKPIVDKYLNPKLEEYVSLIISEHFQSRYYLFIKCKDRAGNENETFISMKIASPGNDIVSPTIIGSEPQNSSLIKNDSVIRFSVFTDEYASCRFDTSISSISQTVGSQAQEFNDMCCEMECPSSEYDVTFNGTYGCMGKINQSELNNVSEINSIRVRCYDQPDKVDVFDVEDFLILSPTYNGCWLFDGITEYKLICVANDTRCDWVLPDTYSNDSKVWCFEGNVNFNTDYFLNISVSEDLAVYDSGPEGIVNESKIWVEFDNKFNHYNVSCAYTNNASYAFYSMLRVDNMSSGTFGFYSEPNSNETNYNIRCSDIYGHNVEENISFFRSEY
ncbi:hypothetical protein K9M79_00745 [Candidatus Woesearchaeota archaeon]|nr:hypothetical protein [Candidatus Woesearchaeota archaeon]